MATGRVSRVTVFGRVPFPATIVPAGQDGHFLNFSVLVDGLARSKQDKKQRQSGRINCSYFIKGNPAQDPNAVILNNIHNAKTGQGNLGGHTYKSVEVIVEGVMSLQEAENSAYYVSLEMCQATITDNNLLSLYKQLVGGQQQQQEAAVAQQPQLATTAPNMAPRPPAAPAAVAPAAVAPAAVAPAQAGGLSLSAEELQAIMAARQLAQQSQVLSANPAAQPVASTSSSVKELIEGPGSSVPNVAGPNNPV